MLSASLNKTFFSLSQASDQATKSFPDEGGQQRTKKKFTSSELKKMPLQQRSRYLAVSGVCSRCDK